MSGTRLASGLLFLALGLAGTGCGRIGYDPLSAIDGGGGPADGEVATDGGSADAPVMDAHPTDGGEDGGVAPGREVRLTNDPSRSAAPSIAVGGGRYLVLWSDDRVGRFELRARVYQPGFVAVGPELVISTGTASAEAPVAVWSETRFGVFWLESTGGFFTVWGAEIAPDGSSATAARALTGATSNGGSVSAVVEGGEYVLAWSDGSFGPSDVVAARVPFGLGVPDSTVRITPDPSVAYFPSLLLAGDQLGVFYNREVGGNQQVHYAPLSPALAPGVAVQLSSTAGLSINPVGVVGAGELGVLWGDGSDASGDAVWFGRLDFDGTLLTSFRVTTEGPAVFHTLAFGDGDYFLAWGDDRGTTRQVYWETIGPGDARSAQTPLADGPADTLAILPWAAADGASFPVVWEDRRDGNSEVYATTILAP